MQVGKKSRQAISLGIVLTFFVITSVSFPSAGYGIVTGSPAPSEGYLALPAQLGQVTETVFHPKAKGTIIHIQSAHAHAEAQKNIAGILDELQRQKKLKIILVYIWLPEALVAAV